MHDIECRRWPKTVDDAVDMLIVHMSEEEKEQVRNTSEEGLIALHPDLGMCIRNSFGLWEGNEELLETCGSPAMHPDSASAVIIEATRERLRSPGSAG